MLSERWQQIEEIFLTAVEIENPENRRRYLDGVCAEDAELRRRVEEMLAADAGSPSLLAAPVLDESGIYDFAAGLDEADEFVGKIVGKYKIVKEIGRGGMGVVYLAERADGSFSRRAAVKIVKRGMDTKFVLRRFRQERQILAALEHPNISRLLDGGTTTDGLPYLVMEYIEGAPLYRFSDNQRLSINERLRLFRKVCDAVHFAHRNKIIHRDLKPSNVLVKADGTPKLLDFGIAKVLDPEISAVTIDPTATQMRMMTPEYASPEQVRGETPSYASDIYSLGVLLYELLTGHRPYRFLSRAPFEIARVVCDEEPVRPSTGITHEDNFVPTGDGSTLEKIFRSRGNANAEDLRRELSGDLEKIVLKALRKNAAERYRTAEEFAADITRYLTGETVLAESFAPNLPEKPISAGGDAASAVKSVAVLPLKLLSFAAPSIGGDTGSDEFLSVGLTDAIITRLSNVCSFVVRPTSAVLRYGGDNATADAFSAGRELAVDFVLDGRIRMSGARVRVSLQLLDVANESSVWSNQFDETFTDALELEDSISEKVAAAILDAVCDSRRGGRLKKRPTDNPQAYEFYLRGRFHWNQFTTEGFKRAFGYYEKAIRLDPNYALAYTGIADYYNWLGVYAVMPFAESSKAAKDAAARAIEIDDALPEAHSALGFAILTADFNADAAERHNLRALKLNPNYELARVWHAYNLLALKRFDEAIAEARRALELDPLSTGSQHALSWCNYYSRRFEESLTTARKTVADEPQSGLAHLTLAMILRQLGAHDEAVREAETAVNLLSRYPYTLSWLARIYAAAGQTGKAHEILDEIEAMSRTVYSSPYLLALVYVNLKDYDRAFALLETAVEQRDGWLVWLELEPQLKPLRSDARFVKLLNQKNDLRQ